MAERGLCKPEVRGSNPLTSTKIRGGQKKGPVDKMAKAGIIKTFAATREKQIIKRAPALERSVPAGR